MENPPNPKPEDEQSLVKLYTELTGTTESSARAVLMHLELPEPAPAANENSGSSQAGQKPS
jgi:hypothetical protein